MRETESHEARMDRMIREASEKNEDPSESHRTATRMAVRALGSEQKERLLDIALQIVQSDNAVFDDKRLAGRFVNVTLDAMDAVKGGIFSRDAKGEVITLSARRGATSLDEDDFSRTQIAEAIASGKTVRPPAEGYSALAPSSISRNLPGPSIVVPIMAPPRGSDAGRSFAAICLARSEGEAPFDEDEEFLDLVAKLISPLLHRSQLHQAAVERLQEVEGERDSLRSRARDLEEELIRRDAKGQGFGQFMGRRSRGAQQCLEKAMVAASSRSAPIVILGETGAGKGRIAKAIHLASPRRDAIFKAVDCGALTEGTNLNSELFGHVKGAYTGADRDRAGAFRVASGGTVFLDEVTELTAEAQAKLLRVLQDKVVTPVGADEEVEVDVRVLVATNKDLEREVKQGRFRDDLYSRLKVVTIVVPPLRERKEDIGELARHFLEKWAKEEGIETTPEVTPEAMKELRDHVWQDNVRGLENCMRRLLLFSRGRIEADDVREALGPAERPATKERLEWSREKVIALLESHEWNVTKARRSVGISKSSIYRLLEKYGLKRPDEPGSEECQEAAQAS